MQKLFVKIIIKRQCFSNNRKKHTTTTAIVFNFDNNKVVKYYKENCDHLLGKPES